MLGIESSQFIPYHRDIRTMTRRLKQGKNDSVKRYRATIKAKDHIDKKKITQECPVEREVSNGVQNNGNMNEDC